MAVTLIPQQGEITAQIDFTEPSFVLFSNMLALGGSLFKHLSPHGVRLADLKFQGGDPSYADAQITCSIFSLLAEVHVRPDRVDIRTFDTSKRSEMFEALRSAATAVAEHATDIGFRSFGSTTALHGKLQGNSTSGYISEFVKDAPERAGAVLSAGVAYYFAPDAARLMSSITLEPSNAVQDGLYLRLVAVWDSQQQRLEELQVADHAYLEHALTVFGVDLP
ncbi:MAG TPA: hypothetical protein VE974_14275 [Thermoanaerobaculia bacterium]|nr:hypothetical protein [Thermoanaerobaculia bacterium]